MHFFPDRKKSSSSPICGRSLVSQSTAMSLLPQMLKCSPLLPFPPAGHFHRWHSSPGCGAGGGVANTRLDCGLAELRA